MKVKSTSARSYRETVRGQTIVLPSGSVFKVRPLTMDEYMDIVKKMMARFKKIRPEAIMTIGWDAENPDVMLEYSKLALPLCVIEPKVKATEKDVVGEDELSVEILAPADLIRLNMLSTTASPGVRALIQSFLAEQPSPEESERIRSMAETATE